MPGRIAVPLNSGGSVPGPPGPPGSADTGDVSVYGTIVTYGSPAVNAHLTTDDFRGDFLNVHDFGAVPDGTTNNYAAFTAAFLEAKNLGGASIYVPKGRYKITPSIVLDSTYSNIRLWGEGASSIILSGGSLSAGMGLFDISGATDIEFANLLIDGQVTTAVGVLYSTITDPMQSSLSSGTTIWVHGGSKRLKFDNITIQHSGGYALLFDARSTGDIDTVIVRNCIFQNNRPNLFGNSSGDLNYGSWTGGLHYQGDGTTYAVTNLLVEGCTFRRNTGNCLWGHLYAFGRLHENIRVIGCHFIDCGLDGVLMGGVTGGCVVGCTFRRIGYVCTDDTSASVPKWLAGANATALDTSGLVRDCNYTSNTFMSINGGCMDGDGFCQGTVTDNTCIIPSSGEPEYTEDSIASFGPGSSGQNWTYGWNLNNSQNLALAATAVNVSGNTFVNMGAGAVRMYASRNGFVTSNRIIHPTSPNGPPITLGNIGTGANQRAGGNVVADNSIMWAPGSASAAVTEDSSLGAFTSADVNWILNNRIPATSNAFEFAKDANSGTVARMIFSSQANGITAKSETWIQRETALIRWYTNIGGTATSVMTLQDSATVAYESPPGPGGPMLNVTAGSGTGGIITTGPRTTSAFDDAMLTSKGYFDGFVALTDTTFHEPEADLLTNTVALLRYRQSIGYIEQSIATFGGSRIWVPLGASTAAGSDTLVQYNRMGVLGADANFYWDYIHEQLNLIGLPGNNTLVVQHGLIYSNDGFSSTNGSYATLNGEFISYFNGMYNCGMRIQSEFASPPSGAGGYLHFEALNYGNYPIALSGDSTFTSNTILLWSSGLNSTPTAVTSTSLNCNAAMNAANGFNTASTSTMAIQAPSGGVNAKWLITTDSLFFISETAPALSGTNQARIYLDSSLSMKISINGGVYVPFSSPAPPNTALQFNSTGQFAATSNLTWNDTLQVLTIVGISGFNSLVINPGSVIATGGFNSTTGSFTSFSGNFLTSAGGVLSAGLSIYNSGSSTGGYAHFEALGYANYPTVFTGDTAFTSNTVLLWSSGLNMTATPVTSTSLNCNAAMNAADGFNTASTSTMAIQAPGGGVNAKWLITTDSLFFISEATPALSGANQARLYLDSTSLSIQASINGGAYHGLSSPGGSTGDIQYNAGFGQFAGVGQLTWDPTNQVLTVTGLTGGHDAIVTTAGDVHSADGFSTNTGNITTGSGNVTSLTGTFIASNGGFFGAGAGLHASGSTGGYLRFEALGYANYPVVLAADTFSGTSILLWSSGLNMTASPVTSTYLNCNAAINAANGFATLSTSTTAIQAPNGAVTGRWLSASDSFFLLAEAAPALSGASQARLYLDSTSLSIQASINGGAYHGLGSPGGTTGDIQYNAGFGQFAGVNQLTWDPTNQVLTVTGLTGGHDAIVTTAGDVHSFDGFSTNTGNFTTASGNYTTLTGSYLASAGGMFNSGVGIHNSGSNTGGYLRVEALGYANFPVPLAIDSFTGTSILLWSSGLNSTPSQITSTSLNCNAAYNSAVGFNTSNTNTFAIQAQNGGVTARYLVATDSLFLVAEAQPALAPTGQARIYLDSSGVVRGSINGNPYQSFGVTPAAGSINQIQYNGGNTPSTFAASPNFTWTPASLLLSVFGNTGTAGIAVAGAYVQADGGFDVTSSTAWNSIQTPGGIKALGSLQCGPNFTSDQGAIGNNFLVQGSGNGIVAFVIDAYGSGNVPALVGRHIEGSPSFSATANGAVLLTFGGRGTIPGSITGSNSAAIIFQASENWVGSSNVGADINFATVPNGSGTGSRTSRMSVRNSGLVEIFGTASSTALQVDNGWISCLDATNGGIHAAGVQFNVIQAPGGGLYGGLGVTSDQAIYLLELGGTTPNNPGIKNGVTPWGGIGYSTGSKFWYWNATTTSWGLVDFAATGGGGISSINGQVGPAITLGAGSGVSISQASNIITISATGTAGVSSLNGFTGALTLSSGTGVTVSGLTISIGQSVNTNSNVNFNSVVTTTNVSVGGSLTLFSSSGTIIMNGTTVINSSLQFVGNGINIGANGVNAGGYNINGGFIGQSWNIQLPSGQFVIEGVGNFTTLEFKGGVLVSAA